MEQSLDQQNLFKQLGLTSSSQNNHRQSPIEQILQGTRAQSAFEPARNQKQSDNSIFKKQDNSSFIEERSPAQPQKSNEFQTQDQSFNGTQVGNMNNFEQKNEYYQQAYMNNQVQSQQNQQKVVENQIVQEAENEGEDDDDDVNDYNFNKKMQDYQESIKQIDNNNSPQQEQQHEKQENSVILQMYISIPGQDQEAVLELSRNESIQQAASRFAKLNKLDKEAEEQILQALYVAVEDKQDSEENLDLEDQHEEAQIRGGFNQMSFQQDNQYIQEEDDDENYNQRKSHQKQRDFFQQSHSKQSTGISQAKNSQFGFFDRVYANQSLSNFTNSNIQHNNNPGVRLYNQFEKERRKKIEEQEQLEKQEKQRQEEELKKLKQYPIINQKSAEIVKKKREKGEEPGQKDSYIKNFKISMIKQYYQQKELEQCTFQPQINQISRSLGDCLKQYRNFKDVYSNLYFESKIKQAEKQQVSIPSSSSKELEKECTFQPITNKQDKIKMNITGSFLERNKEYIEKKNQKAKNMQFLHQNVDITTGKKLFEPNIIQKNGSEKRSNNQIFEELYSLNEKKKKQQEEEEKKRNQQKQQIHLSEQTNNLVERQRKRKIEELFNKLDDDCDGFISGNKIAIEKIDKNVVILLLPILEEIDKRCLELDFQQFYEGFNTYFNQMNAQDRHLILFGNSKTNKPLKNSQQNNFTFSPQLNQKSLKIAMKKDYLDQFGQNEMYNQNVVGVSEFLVDNQKIENIKPNKSNAANKQ
ncbi:hypothetical protein TTHERM_00620970 (macronuclear) [Tetrahymena thermophila SB210]|uniref:EF-hand domain-containing protein n=1 Tax=Tetrahymena thermophila (strain SB210) TaxID=312017 RepID=Q23MG2_TETTS|nr:hypothetical protein TTHERM_00620970 [Tetrahymena thermophila SB210]EAR97677.2 hypothetical protein TTHERM_00620970 [Tetrahymena thermophila SB210]|eukprot:XP_001017922.2 hypothetical protein TTHERM_00620970 [Tetrahymena thermophila SB210]